MSAIRPEDLSPFGRLALKLDLDFTALTRLSGQLQRVELDSDSGLERAVKLLNQFADHGSSIADGIQDFSRVLQDARTQSEAAAAQVAERAEEIRARRARQNDVRAQLADLEEKVKATNAGLAGFRKEGGNYSAAEQQKLKSDLERLYAELKQFLKDAQVIKDAAGQANFKGIERDTQALLDALRSSCRKLEKALGAA